MSLESKLQNIVQEGKPKRIIHEKIPYYISKTKIKHAQNLKKEGGVFPLIPLLLGIGTAASIGGATAGIVKAANDKAANDISLEQQKEHDDRVEKLLKGGPRRRSSPK